MNYELVLNTTKIKVETVSYRQGYRVHIQIKTTVSCLVIDYRSPIYDTLGEALASAAEDLKLAEGMHPIYDGGVPYEDQ
jgi:hypothetical protein